MAWRIYGKQEQRLLLIDETAQFLKDTAKYPAHRKTAQYLLDQIGMQTATTIKK